MHVHDLRPAAAELQYQLYARALHPELFDVCASRRIDSADYVLKLRICESGHLIELRGHDETVMEISVDASRELPRRGRCLTVPLGAGRDLEAEPVAGLMFQASVQLETLEPEVFERVSQEFQADMPQSALAHVFNSRNRLRPEAVSLVFADCGPRSVGIHAYHTFPDDLAIVRTQSLYEFRGPQDTPGA